MQAKLLRALQERRIVRVEAPMKFPSMCASCGNQTATCAADVGDGRFRDRLYYRINVLSIDVPPLRERREDIPVLIDYFSEEAHAQYFRLDKGFSSGNQTNLYDYGWPGNVRQLESAIERAILLCEGDLNQSEDLPSEVQAERRRPSLVVSKLPAEGIKFRRGREESDLQAMGSD